MALSQRAEHGRRSPQLGPRIVRLVSISTRGARRPNLFVNPLSDTAFASSTQAFVTGGASRPEDLAALLRPAYPDVVARKREISGEAESWYVYRDGHWVDDESSTD